MSAHQVVVLGPRQYKCTICGQTWTRQPHARCPGPTHELIQRATDQFECRVCAQVWSSPPQNVSDNRCPQLKVYPRYTWEPLMSRLQLDYANYRTTDAALPAPVGCYRNGSGSFVMLYDPAHAQQKSSRPQARTTRCVSQIAWPRAWLHWFERGIGHARDDNNYSIWLLEIAPIAYHLLPFSQAEIEQAVGPCVQLRLQPMIVHLSHAFFVANRDERTLLLHNVIDAYRNLKEIK